MVFQDNLINRLEALVEQVGSQGDFELSQMIVEVAVARDRSAFLVNSKL